MTRLTRHAQPDLLLAKVELRLLPDPAAQKDATIEVAAGLVMVGVVWTFVVLLYFLGGQS